MTESVENPSTTATEATTISAMELEPLSSTQLKLSGLLHSHRLLWTVPWSLAALGWLAAALFAVYSHGQSDRVRTTRQQSEQQLAAMNAALSTGLIVQHFAATPNVRMLQFKPVRGTNAGPAISLLYAPGYIHAAVVGRGLPRLQSGQVFEVWAQRADKRWTAVGALAPQTTGAETATIVVGPLAIDRYRNLSLNVERNSTVTTPTTAMLYSVKLTDQPS